MFCIFLQKTFVVVDAKFHDNQSSDKTSEYIITKGTLTKTYVQDEYIQLSGNAKSFNACSPVTLSTSDNWSIEADIQQTNLSNLLFIGYILQSANTPSNYISFLIYSNETASYGYGSPNTYLFRDSSLTGTVNTWYHMKWECNNGELHYLVYDMNNTLLFDKTITLPSVYTNINVSPSFVRYSDDGQTMKIRNVIVKTL